LAPFRGSIGSISTCNSHFTILLQTRQVLAGGASAGLQDAAQHASELLLFSSCYQKAASVDLHCRLEELARPVPDSGARRARSAASAALRKNLSDLMEHLTIEIEVRREAKGALMGTDSGPVAYIYGSDQYGLLRC